MNVTVIPFLLVANMFADVSVWPFGPQYSYNLTITHETKRNATDDIIRARLNTTIQCRLDIKFPDILFCRFNKLSMNNKNLMNYVVDDVQNFGIKFNNYGVENLLFDLPKKDKTIVYIIKKIANQFNIYNYAICENSVKSSIQFIFIEKENNCTISNMYKLREQSNASIKERSGNFQFVSSQTCENYFPVPLKIQKQCTYVSENFNPFAEGIVKMEETFSTIEVNDMYKTFTEIKGYVKSPNNLVVDRFDTFKETIELNLETIDPMQEDFYISKIPSLPQLLNE